MRYTDDTAQDGTYVSVVVFILPVTFTFSGPCILIYLRSKNEQDALFFFNLFQVIFLLHVPNKGNAVAQWLRHCSTNWKVAGSIPDGVIGIFH
jgi:uncharacterized membrane protein YobD (UPF0266 family)